MILDPSGNPAQKSDTLVMRSCMEARFYKPSDYSEISKWWEARQFPLIPQAALPKYGVIVEGFCAGFLYRTDSSIAIMEWVVSNPESDKVMRNDAMNLLVKKLINLGTNLGFESIFTSLNNKKLASRYESFGFVETDKEATNYVAKLR